MHFQQKNNMHKKRRKIWPYILLTFFILFAGLGIAGYSFIKKIEKNPASLLENGLVKQVIKEKLGDEGLNLFSLAPHFLGFDKPRTFVVLFLNNTEIRPGGGFIGVYSTIRVDKGRVEILKVEGTETIDNAANRDKLLEPPQILQDQLKVKHWFFRDSNWSPDFALSSAQSLDFYTRENGIASDEVDTVFAITTNVLEEVLKITGPVTIDGITFEHEDVTETLEYEVEFGYKDRGISFANRKAILKPFMQTLLSRLGDEVFEKSDEYFDLIDRMGKQKHILAYSKDEELQNTIETLGWTGKMHQTDGDYLMWVDANLAALKTDYAIKRNVTYTSNPDNDKNMISRTKMVYTHTGSFDWRTSRYRTYARVYVPEGSKLISGKVLEPKGEKILSLEDMDTGVENGKTWFAFFMSIEPGTEESLEFEYMLPKSAYENGDKTYTLFVQKQLGTNSPGLTLDLNFGKNITGANPAEEESQWGDRRYRYETDLLVDRQFDVEQ